MERCWQSARKGLIALQREQSLPKGVAVPPADALYTGADLKRLAEALEAAAQTRARAEERARVRAWKQWINEAWDTTPRMVYRWIRGSGDTALQMVKKKNGRYSANIWEMDEAIRAAWKPINKRYESIPEPSVDKFMDEYRRHVKHGPMKARELTGDVLLQRARKMGVKTANGLDLWSIKLLKRLPAPFWDALAELLRVVERTGRWPERVAEGFTSWVPKGEGEGDPMKLRPLTMLSQIYRMWAGLRMEDALQWQEQWILRESYGFRPHKGAMDAATVLTLLVELAQVLDAPLVGAGTDYTKCFNLIPQAISMALLELQGMDGGVLRAFRGMYDQLKRMFKIKGCLGAWWAATNGVLQGCPLSVIVINALTTTCKGIIDNVKQTVTVNTKNCR